MSKLLLKNIRKVYGVPSDEAKPLSICVDNGIIQEIVNYESIVKQIGARAIDEYTVLNCSDLIALPGFVDSHTHLLFYGSRENELYMRAASVPYMKIMADGGGIYNTVKAVRNTSEEELIKNGLRFLDKALSFGTTTIEIKSGYGLDFNTEKKMLTVINTLNRLHPVDIIPTFLVHTVPRETDRKKYIDSVMNRMIPAFREYSEWFDIFLEKGVFDLRDGELLIQKAIDSGYNVGIHTNQVNDIGGVKLAVEHGVRHIDHLELLTEEDAELIIQNKSIYPVFLPGAEAYLFSGHTGQIHQLLKIPSRIVISTDFNPGSSPVLCPGLVMSLAVLRYRISDPLLLIQAFTRNPAEMLFLEDRGSIKKGLKADILCMELDDFEQLPYFGTLNFIKFVIKNGRIVESKQKQK